MHPMQPHSHRLLIPSHLKAALWNVVLSLIPSSCVNPTVWYSGTGERTSRRGGVDYTSHSVDKCAGVKCIENYVSGKSAKKNRYTLVVCSSSRSFFSPLIKLQNKEFSSLGQRTWEYGMVMRPYHHQCSSSQLPHGFSRQTDTASL